MAEAKRRLAAILSADVAGYSRLMGDDEEATVAALNACRAIFTAEIETRQGRVVDTAGDSVLAEFPSVVEAVRAAVEVQNSLAQRNQGVPDARRMLFRIGINLGDVIGQDDGSIYGDGVNVAARLEALAEPGGISISGTAFDHVDGKIDRGFVFTGEHRVKNIVRPVRAYRIADGASSGVTEAVVETSSSPNTHDDKPSIVVLPFDNMSGDPEQGYFADGISEDVITDLSKISGLFVIARNSAFTYKGQSVNVERVCRELGVRYVLEGSVRKAGRRVRVNAQLIDGTNSGHLWAERYDRELDDIFEVQDELTQQIVSALKIQLTPSEQQVLAHKGTTNLDAYDAFWRARALLYTYTKEAITEARSWLDTAIRLDPDFAAPVAMAAIRQMTEGLNQGGTALQESLQTGYDLASRAVSLDDLEPLAHMALGVACLWLRKHDRAIEEVDRALSIDPNMADAHVSLSMIRHYAGDSITALRHIDASIRLSPLQVNFLLHVGAQCHYMLGDYESAAAKLLERITKAPDTDISRALLAAAYGQLGRAADGQAVWADLMTINPNYSFAEKRKVLPYKNPEDMERMAEGLRKAGIDIDDDRAS